MSNLIPAGSKLTASDIQLIRDTIAKGATDSEMKLFLERCQRMGLDPLKPGQIHFAKYGGGPGTIIIGREGFRARAAKTGKHTGTKLGVIRDESGSVLGAWCEVYRSDWTQPAREEVFLEEYDTGKAQWAKMPITMIKKVAECAALRMAFPDELGGVYSAEEMDQAEERTPRQVVEKTHAPDMPDDPGSHVIRGGAMKDRTIREVVDEKGLPAAQNYIQRLEEMCTKDNRPLFQWAMFMKVALDRYADQLEREANEIEAQVV